jgi:Holliday junction resolvase
MKAHKVDLNQAGIVKRLRMIPGVSVVDTSIMGKGFPDLVIGYRGRNYLFEVKNPDKKKLYPYDLTPAQVKFLHSFRGDVHIVVDYENVCKILGLK